MIRAIYVDDEPGLLEIAKFYLERMGGIEVIGTCETSYAYNAAVNNEVDIIISDYQMPRENGIQFLKRIRSSGSQIPVIIFTGKGREEVVIEALNNGADFYVQKGGDVKAQFTDLAHKIRVGVERSIHRKEIQKFSEIVLRMEPGLMILELMKSNEPGSFVLRHINPSGQRIMPGENIIGQYMQDLMPDMVDDVFSKNLVEVVKTNKPIKIQDFSYSAMGVQNRYFNIDAFPLDDRNLGILIQDISPRKYTEQKLVESERAMRELMDSAGSIILRWRHDGTIIYLNEYGEKLFGYERDEIIGKNLVGTIVPLVDMAGNDLSDMIKCITHQPHLFRENENENITKDGRRIWVRWSNNLVSNIHDGGIEVISVGIDITESHDAHKKLLESQKRLNDIIEFLPDATLSIDLDGRVIAWNRAMEQLSGVLKEDILGRGDHEYSIPFYGKKRKQLMDLIDNDDMELINTFNNFRREGLIIYAEAFAQSLHNGMGAYLWAKASPLLDESGKRVGAIESIRDVSELKAYELTLRAEKERYKIINDSSSDLIYSYDRDGRFTSVNRRLCDNLMRSEESIIGRTHEELGFSKESCDEWQRFHDEVYQTDRTVTHFTSTKMPDGKVHQFEVILNPMHGGDGRIIGIAGTTRDISDRKEDVLDR